nr:26S proteasome regulatory subunit 6B-like isoform X2 [Zonotrichia albicollis]
MGSRWSLWGSWSCFGFLVFPSGSRCHFCPHGHLQPWFLGGVSSPAAFIRVVGSEFVQKYLGEGPRMVRDVFRLAKENAPAIIFIDEIDAIATKRFDAQTGADREVQRILLELLNQMDGFDQNVNVKEIMATNREDTWTRNYWGFLRFYGVCMDLYEVL